MFIRNIQKVSKQDLVLSLGKGKDKGIDSGYSALLYLHSSYNTNSLTWTIGSSKQTSVARHVQS